ncbi:MAG TPA: hypothetical protein PKU80_12575 [Candidatus Limiplasma sp.]|nr:hypothetical protein [Candidatus Limiplasma sp.]
MPCLICGDSSGTNEPSQNSYICCRCKNGHNFNVAEEIYSADSKKQNRFFNMIAEIIQHKPQHENKYWHFYYNPDYQSRNTNEPQYINLAERENDYPDRFMEKAHKSLINLSRLCPNFDDDIYDVPIVRRATLCNDIKSDYETEEFLARLAELDYLSTNNGTTYHISSRGWIKIDELTEQDLKKKQGFLALRFSSETSGIREAVRTAIKNAGYDMMVIDEKEHNNQIVPEILYEIKNSSFLVVDITHPSYGAYYEAGYASGCGIEVIVCCRKEVLDNPEKYPDRPHFDISQKNMVPWEDINDLQERLTRRINATVNLKML